MISRQASIVRASIVPETIDAGWTLESERSDWENAVKSDRLAAGTTERDDTVAGRRVLWIAPDGVLATDAIMVYVHRGGLTAGSLSTHRAFASRLAAGSGLQLLLVDYQLLPDSAFPAPLDDVVSVIDELVSSGRSVPNRIVLAGDSNGAALAFSAACVLRDQNVGALAGIVSLSGAFDATLSGDSIDADRDPQLSRLVLEHWQRTVSVAVDPRDPLMSPLFAALHDLPPSLLLCGGDDVWLSDSLRLAEKLAAAGNSVLLDVVGSMWHVWPMHGEFPEADAAISQVAAFVNRVTC